jgi:hypothetical protein
MILITFMSHTLENCLGPDLRKETLTARPLIRRPSTTGLSPPCGRSLFAWQASAMSSARRRSRPRPFSRSPAVVPVCAYGPSPIRPYVRPVSQAPRHEDFLISSASRY